VLLEGRVWGPLAIQDDVLHRMAAFNTVIFATDPILLEPLVTVEEEARIVSSLKAILLAKSVRQELGPAIRRWWTSC
jgi:hypothetical protein